jgi:hypothetical protein
MKKIIFSLIAACAFQSTHTMKLPSQESLNNDLISAIAKGDLDLMQRLLAAGAQVNKNYRSYHGTITTPLEYYTLYRKNSSCCKLLLDHGADVYAYGYPSETRILSRIAIEDPALLSSIVLAPNAHVLAASHTLMKTILLCFKRTCPQLPKDIRLMILAKREHLEDVRWGKDEDHIVGNVMIARKLQGLPILDIFKETAIHTLYGCTMRTMIDRFQKVITEEEAARPVAIIHGYIIPAPSQSLLRSRINVNKFEATNEEALRATIIARFEQNKLLCNNPSQAFERQDEQVSNNTQKCTIQ